MVEDPTTITGKRWTPGDAMKEEFEIHEPKEKVRKKLGEPMRIYVAGPYSPSIIKPTPTLHDASLYAQRHTDAAVAAGWVLMGRGHFPYIPHLSHYVHIQTPEGQPPLPSKWWVDFDVAFLEVCDAILMIGDWRNSRGAVSELDYAKEHAMYVFYEVNDVPDTTEMDMSTDVRFIDKDK